MAPKAQGSPAPCICLPTASVFTSGWEVSAPLWSCLIFGRGRLMFLCVFLVTSRFGAGHRVSLLRDQAHGLGFIPGAFRSILGTKSAGVGRVKASSITHLGIKPINRCREGKCSASRANGKQKVAKLQPLDLIPGMDTLETGGTKLLYLFFLIFKQSKPLHWWLAIAFPFSFSLHLCFPISY